MSTPSPSSEVWRSAQTMADDLKQAVVVQREAFRVDARETLRRLVQGTLLLAAAVLFVGLGMPLLAGGIVLICAEHFNVRPGLAFLTVGASLLICGLLAGTVVLYVLGRLHWFSRSVAEYRATTEALTTRGSVTAPGTNE